MSTLLPSPLSAPAERVEAETDFGTERFSRTLDQRNPHTRSSTAQIVPMDAEEPLHPADALVVKCSAIAAAVFFVIYLVEWFAS